MYVDGIGPVEPPKPVKGTEEVKREKLKGSKREEITHTDAFQRGDTDVIDRLKMKSKDVEAVRIDLVKEIKRAVESGSYVVDVSKLASKILEELRGGGTGEE